ncbi:SGNH/GDSL hydrolase family protein [soil metagenome]
MEEQIPLPVAAVARGAYRLRRLAIGGGSCAATLAATTGLIWAQVGLAKRRNRPDTTPPVTDGTVDGPEPIRVCWLGDSLAAGLGAGDADATMARLAPRLAGRGADVRNLAVPGATVARVLATQLPALAALRASGWEPQLVMVAAGANDVAALTTRGRYRAGFTTLLDALTPLPVVALSIPDLGMADRLASPLRQIAGARGRMLDATLHRLAAARAVPVVDIATRPPGMCRSAGRTLLSADRFHPGPAAYELWAHRVATTLAAVAL